ncbi:MAG: hypothetical protein GF400_04030 [Candidatus Eisenbacteria bacterium]|nr:hypothetical protein [Candidatus Eisenbacteria bacterium]
MRRCSARPARRFCALLLCALALAVSAGAARGYDYYIAPELYELPLVDPMPAGVRTMGMGGAGLAAVDDASAAMTNPAGLTRLGRIELGAGLSRSAMSLDVSAFGDDSATNLTDTDLRSLRVAYPFPTFRGSLVFAFSGEQVYDFDSEFIASYSDAFAGTEGQIVDQAELLESTGGIRSWNLSAAFKAAERISLGGTISYLSGTYDRSFTWVADEEDFPGAYEGSITYQSEDSSDVSGFRATVGGLFQLNEAVAAALVVQSPVKLSFTGVRDERAETSADEFRQEVNFEDEITLPFSFSAGLAYTPTDFLVFAGDLKYTDWSEIEYAGRVFLDEESDDPEDLLAGRRYAYEEVLDVMLGAEVILPAWPVRLRAGYAMRPVAYQGLDVDVDRSYLTLGVGVLIDPVLSVDAAWQGGSFEREGPDYDYSETRDMNTIVLEASYRF